jgi:protein-tyrosine phosphatase
VTPAVTPHSEPPGRSCDDPRIATATPTPRWLALDGAVNVRAVVPGVLLRADNLQSLSGRDVRLLIDEQGVEVVLDLRTDVEVALEGPGPLTSEPSVRIEHRSLYPDSGGNTDFDIETVKPWQHAHDDELADEPPVVRAYVSYLRRRPDSIVGSMRAIARARGAALVHCAAGKDRTGVVVALALDAAGVERDAIVADYLASRDRIEEIMARLMSSTTYRAELEAHDAHRHAPMPETIERFFEIVDERFGGSAAWLTENGLERADIERLMRRLGGSGDGGPGPGGGEDRLERAELGAQLIDERRPA